MFLFFVRLISPSTVQFARTKPTQLEVGSYCRKLVQAVAGWEGRLCYLQPESAGINEMGLLSEQKGQQMDIRRAQAQDRAVVLALINAIDPDDYIPTVGMNGWKTMKMEYLW